MSQTPYNSLLMSSITPGHENRSHYRTHFSALFARSQQILIHFAGFVDFPLMSRQVASPIIGKLYTSFWTHLALRDVYRGYTTTAEATQSAPDLEAVLFDMLCEGHSYEIVSKYCKLYPQFDREIMDCAVTASCMEALAPDYTPYLTGHAHGTAYLPYYFVPKFIEDAQVEYELSLSPADHSEYMRGYVEGFSEQPCQPERGGKV